MTKAPERFWLKWKPGKAITQGPLTEHPDYTECVTADHALALVAAAYEDAGLCSITDMIASEPYQIADAQAALDRLLQEACNEALREAAELAFEADDCYLARNAILALITEDQSDDV